MLIWRYTVLKGYEGLKGLHGTLLEQASYSSPWDPPIWDTYAGQVHFDPK